MIERGEPALMLCHWPGMYCNGTKSGFIAFQNVVQAIHARFRDQTLWMKLSEIARYYAAKEVTEIRKIDQGFAINAPFAAPQFTIKIRLTEKMPSHLTMNDKTLPLKEVGNLRDLRSGTWLLEGTTGIVCFDLPKGQSLLTV